MAAVYAFFIATFVYRDMGPLATAGGRERKPSLLRGPRSLVTAFFHADTRARCLMPAS